MDKLQTKVSELEALRDKGDDKYYELRDVLFDLVFAVYYDTVDGIEYTVSDYIDTFGGKDICCPVKKAIGVGIATIYEVKAVTKVMCAKVTELAETLISIVEEFDEGIQNGVPNIVNDGWFKQLRKELKDILCIEYQFAEPDNTIYKCCVWELIGDYGDDHTKWCLEHEALTKPMAELFDYDQDMLEC